VLTRARAARALDLTRKGWLLLTEALKNPGALPTIVLAVTKGGHAGELVRIARNRKWLECFRFRTLLDVGAGTGQFTIAWLSLFPRSRVYAFEPLADCFRVLERKLGARNGSTAFNVALGNRSGESEFWRSSFKEASSPLQMTNRHAKAFPWSARTEELRVRMVRLDDLGDELAFEEPVLMKVDVQGYELEVLKGAARTLGKVMGIIVETSFVELYEGQPLFEDLYRWLRERGYRYRGAWDQLRDPATGEIVQQDGIFLRA